MSNSRKNSFEQDSKFLALAIAIGVVINSLLAFIAEIFDLPIYLDTIGTIGVSVVSGAFPGIMTAVLTNTLCTLFNEDSICFGFINALIAIYTAWFVRNNSFKSKKNIIFFILSTGLISGVIGAIVQWSLFHEAQNQSIADTVKAVSDSTSFPSIILFFFINTLLNIVDKGVCLFVSILALHYIPERIIDKLQKNKWRQHPLSVKDIKSIREWGKNVRCSVRTRMTVMLLVVSVGLVSIMGWVVMLQYYDHTKEEKIQSAEYAAQLTASVIDEEEISDYIKYGKEAPGYADIEELLYRLRDNTKGIERVCVVKAEDRGFIYVFDIGIKNSEKGIRVKGYEPGHFEPFEDKTIPYIETLIAGEKPEPFIKNRLAKTTITAFYPVSKDGENSNCFAMVDLSLAYLIFHIKDAALRIMLIMAGFFILIVGLGIWTTGVYSVYPISSVAMGVERFIKSGNEQKELDKSVKALRNIHMRTEDELEKLYLEICDMASNQAEQIRSIKRFSENTAKMQDGLIITMADLVENRDSDTGAHIQKTASYVEIIVEGLERKGYYPEKITPKFKSDVVRSAPLHDVGKINISDAVLNKPGKLTDEEYEIIKTHTTAGKKIIENAIKIVEGESYLKEARNMAAYHHERWDGKGYPEGLHGEVIPLSARIMAVADVFDALASPRVYKPAFPFDEAIKIIQEGSGTQFDPKCVEVFLEAIPEVKAVLRKYD